MLSHEETMELLQKAKHGDDAAKSTLLSSNIPLIKSIIKRYKNKGVDYDDLVQIGSMGLLKAINNFDMSYEVRFSTYAVPMIMGEVKRFLRDDGYMKVSRSVKTLFHKVNKYISDRKMLEDNVPTIAELSEHFGVEPQEIVFCMDAAKMPISIHEKVDEDDEKSQSVMDRLVMSDDTESLIDRLALKTVLQTLKVRERKIIMYRYFRDLTQGEIAQMLGISQVQVSRLEAKILSKIKEKMKI